MQPNLGLTALVINLCRLSEGLANMQHAYLHTRAGCPALLEPKVVQIPITAQHVTKMAKAAFIQHLGTCLQNARRKRRAVCVL